MTVEEAIQAGHRFVTIKPWNEYAHLILPKVVDGVTQGVWGYIVDPCGAVAVGNSCGNRIPIILIEVPSQISIDTKTQECEVWIEPIDYRTRFGDPEGDK